MTTSTRLTKPQAPHVCPHQCAFFLDNWLRRLIQHPRRIVGPYIQAGDTVIDMGCGPGYFTIDMAKMVGPQGSVIAVDIQKKMLAHVRKKAQRHGVAERIACHLAGTQHSALNQQADFILAFYMIHETPDVAQTLREFKQQLKIGGRLLAVEPRMHVKKTDFEDMLRMADTIGLTAAAFPKRMGGRSVLLKRVQTPSHQQTPHSQAAQS